MIVCGDCQRELFRKNDSVEMEMQKNVMLLFVRCDCGVECTIALNIERFQKDNSGEGLDN